MGPRPPPPAPHSTSRPGQQLQLLHLLHDGDHPLIVGKRRRLLRAEPLLAGPVVQRPLHWTGERGGGPGEAGQLGS